MEPKCFNFDKQPFAEIEIKYFNLIQHEHKHEHHHIIIHQHIHFLESLTDAETTSTNTSIFWNHLEPFPTVSEPFRPFPPPHPTHPTHPFFGIINGCRTHHHEHHEHIHQHIHFLETTNERPTQYNDFQLFIQHNDQRTTNERPP